MTTHVSGAHPGAAAHRSARSATRARSGISSGWLLAAATLMIFGGLMALLAGISAIVDDEVFVATRNYIFEFDLTGWGWVHLAIGAVTVISGAALFSGASWARVTGAIVAGAGMLASFLWLPYTEGWGIAMIAVYAFIIWAVCAAPSSTDMETDLRS